MKGSIVMNKFSMKALAVALLAAAPMMAQAESDFSTGVGALTANAAVDFQVTIPRFLFLRVGTGGMMADDGSVDLISFTVPATNVGDGSVVAGTGGNLGAGSVVALARGNNGAITVSVTGTGALSNGAGDTIPFTEITTVHSALSAPFSAPTSFPALTLADGAGSSLVLATLGASRVTNAGATWTYTYNNSATYAAGVYGGVNTNNSRQTYTASMP
jgi:hypothetical protein